MAKKRTRKQKQSTHLKRQQPSAAKPSVTYTYQLADYSSSETVEQTKLTKKQIQYSYDPNLIIADLKKTIFLSAFIFTILGIIYYASLNDYFGFLG